MKYRHIRDYKRPHTELLDTVSQTIPDQSLTIRQIIDRYTRGLPLETKVPIFDGEDAILPDPRTLDLAEREEFARQAQEELEQVKNQIKRRKTEEKPNVPEGNE